MSSLKRLGIDEISLRKGQGDYIVVLVDLDQRVLLGFAPSRKQVDISKALEGWGESVLHQIIEVSIDLSGNYKGLVNNTIFKKICDTAFWKNLSEQGTHIFICCIQKGNWYKLLPNAQVVADRSHVMKLVNQDLDTARKALFKANQEQTDKVEKSRIEAVLKQSKYALLKPEEKLTEKQKAKLEEIREVLPSLAQMHQQKEAFRAIFEQAEDWNDGTFQLLNWLAEAQETFKESVGTICRWFGEVTSYFDNRTTSGAVEGINNKLKLIKRSGYGFRNFNNFQLRCLICWHLAIY